MILFKKLKPSRVTASTKDGVLSKLGRNRCWCSSSLHGHYRAATDDSVIVYNLQKVNMKTKQRKVKGKTVSTIVRKKEWIMFYYYIPFKLLEALNLKVEQGNRNFKLIER